jgi:pyruvate dehydrogenase E2 component (dihydrolipoamide acetyltransferase)
MTRGQESVARPPGESKAAVPDVKLDNEADVEACAAAAGDGIGVSDFVVKAAALALRDVPEANSAFRDHRYERYTQINVAVSAFAGDGMAAPTIFNADAKPVAQIAAERRALAEKAAAGTIAAPELANATFTIYDFSALGVRRAASVVNHPQAAALTIGVPEPRAVVRDGALVARTVVDLTLTCDHRVLYGAGAARFLTRIAEHLADPERLS